MFRQIERAQEFHAKWLVPLVAQRSEAERSLLIPDSASSRNDQNPPFSAKDPALSTQQPKEPILPIRNSQTPSKPFVAAATSDPSSLSTPLSNPSRRRSLSLLLIGSPLPLLEIIFLGLALLWARLIVSGQQAHLRYRSDLSSLLVDLQYGHALCRYFSESAPLFGLSPDSWAYQQKQTEDFFLEYSARALRVQAALAASENERFFAAVGGAKAARRLMKQLIYYTSAITIFSTTSDKPKFFVDSENDPLRSASYEEVRLGIEKSAEAFYSESERLRSEQLLLQIAVLILLAGISVWIMVAERLRYKSLVNRFEKDKAILRLLPVDELHKHLQSDEVKAFFD